MGVFWSGTDDKCCDKLGSGDFTISIVTNRKKKLLGRVDIYKPFRVTLSGIDIAIEDEVDFAIPKAIQDEVDAKVEKRSLLGNWDRNRGSFDYGYGRRDLNRDAEDATWWADGYQKRYNSITTEVEVYHGLSKRWIAQSVFEAMLGGKGKRKDDKKDDKIEIVDDKGPMAVFDAASGTIIFDNNETFTPGKDSRIFGDVPPTDLFEVCLVGDSVCKKCVYMKECDAYLVKER